MRLYCFSHTWLSPQQKGIQAIHAAIEIARQAGQFRSTKHHNFWEWADHHKTVILLEGGNSKMLQELYAFFNDLSNDVIPHGVFHEDDESLEGAMTSVAAVIPPKIYEAATFLRKRAVEWNGEVLVPTDFLENHMTLTPEEFQVFSVLTTQYVYNDWEKLLVEKLPNYKLA